MFRAITLKRIRKNIFLIFKEALHNIVKYAGCKRVDIKLFVENSNLVMIIKDDGQGFPVLQFESHELIAQKEYRGGNGIKNMHARAFAMNASLCIKSKINAGTTVQLILPMQTN